MDQILQDISSTAIARAIEENAIEGVKSWAAWTGMEIHEEADLLWTLSDVPYPIFNNVFRTQLAPRQVENSIDAALARAKARNVPLAWWLGPSTVPADLGRYLEDRGFAHADDLPGLALDLPSLIAGLPMPSDLLAVEEVVDVETLKTWCQVSSDIFELPPFASEAWSGIFSSVPFGPGKAMRHYLARLGGAPVGTSTLFLGAGVAGISSVGTMPEARRKGIGSAVTLTPLKEAQRLGYRIATLFSSEMAVSMYQKLGFKEYCRGSLYIWMNE